MDSFLDALGDLASRLSPGWLLEDPQKVRSTGYLVVLAFFAIVMIVGIVLAMGGNRLSKGQRLHRRLMELYGQWLAWTGGLGVVIIALRYADVQLFSKRLWTALDIMVVLAIIGHFVWYRIRRYPDELAAYNEEERRRRYLPTGGRARRRR